MEHVSLDWVHQPSDILRKKNNSNWLRSIALSISSNFSNTKEPKSYYYQNTCMIIIESLYENGYH